MFNKIKGLLAQKGIKFNDLAEHVKMTPHGLRRSLKTKTTSLPMIKDIAFFLSVPSEYLLFDDEEESKQELEISKEDIVEKLQTELIEKDEIIEFIKQKINELYDLYFSFQLNLNDDEVRSFYKNQKLHDFEVEMLIVIQEVLAMVAKTNEERKKLAFLIKKTGEGASAIISELTTSTSEKNKIIKKFMTNKSNEDQYQIASSKEKKRQYPKKSK